MSSSSSKEISANFDSINQDQSLMAITIKAKFLTFTGVKNLTGHFQITAYSSHSIIMTPNVPVESSFSNSNDYQIFELIVNTTDIAQVKLIPCLGEFKLNVFRLDSSHNLQEEKVEMTKLNSKIIIATIHDPYGHYVINVKPTKL